MTDSETQAAGTVTFTFAQTTPTIWRGTATCPHGTTRNETYLIAVGVPPLNHAAMVDSVFGQHAQLLPNCDCGQVRPKLAATVTFQVPVAAVPPGQQRYIPQSAATLTGTDFWWGPGLTCARTGAYAISATVQLASANGRGAGVILVSGQPVYSVPMTGGLATINVTLNLVANQSLAVGYENTSNANQDVSAATLTVSEVWAP